MITIGEAKKIHSILISRHGGTDGIRDESLLSSALNRPYQTIDGKDLNEFPHDKAASIIESILINHPFIDGNKRFGYVAMRLILMEYNFDISATQDDKYEFVIIIAEGKLKGKDISQWIKKHLVKYDV